METVFNGYTFNWGDSDDFYTVTGEFVEFIGDLLPNKTSIPMVMEFGTLNTSTTVGSVKSAHISIVENQGFHYGYKLGKDKQLAKEGFYEMFYPPSDKWRTNAINVSMRMLKDIINNYQKL